MTTLVITPNVKRKTIKCEGRIAAGEHVLVRVETFDEKVGEGKSLRLRAVGPNGETLAVFPPQVKDDDPPRPQEELDWQVDDGDATCVFDFNTAPAEKFLRCGGECLFVLDDVVNHTLYGNGFCTVAPWSKVAGLDAPVDLDGYKDLGDRVADVENGIAYVGEMATDAVSEASDAKRTAEEAARTAETARTDAVNAGNAAISAASSASASQSRAASALSASRAAAAAASASYASAKSASDKFDELSDVAKSGDYSDLKNKPEIPSIAGLATIDGLSAEENRAKGVERDIIVRLENTPTLDEGGKVPSSQLPSYVDDVLEYGDRTRFPMFGEGGKIYVDMSTNHLYRWTGTVYVQIPAGLALGETAASAYPGNKGLENAQGIANLRTSKQAALNAQQLAAVNSGITSSKLANMVTKDDVQPRGDGTEVIAVIGGKEIKAPAGGGGAGDSISDGTNTISADRTFTTGGDDFTEWEYEYEGKGDWRELGWDSELEWLTCGDDSLPMFGQTAWFYGGSSWNVASTDKNATRVAYEAFDSNGSFAVVATRRRLGESGKLALQSDIAEWARAGKEAPGGSVQSVNGKTGDVVLAGDDIEVGGGGDTRVVSLAIHDNETKINSHIAARDNPHGVTVSQIGAVATTDPRLTDARTPTAHASTHAANGSDPITPESIGAILNGGSATGLAVGPIVLTGHALWLGYDTWGGEVPGSGSWNMIKRYTHPSGDVESLPEYLAANYAAADQLAPISAKVDAIEETVNVNNRILVSDDGVDARIQHADEVADGGWADDAVLVTQQRLDIGYPVNDDGMHPKNQSTQVVTTDGAVRIITLTQPEKVDGGTRDFVVYVNHTNPDAANDTYLLLGGDATFYYDGESGEAGFQKFITIPKGVMSAWYFTEIPGGNVWAVGKRALAKFTQGAQECSGCSERGSSSRILPSRNTRAW